jgi:hypothetical protein
MKKLLSVLLAVCMVVGVGAVIASADIPGATLYLDTPKTVFDEYDWDWIDFRFKPAESGAYTIRIEGNFDSLVFALGNEGNFSQSESFDGLNGSWSGDYSMVAGEFFRFTINCTTNDPYTVTITTLDTEPPIPPDNPEPPTPPVVDKILEFFVRFLPEEAAKALTWVVKYLFSGWLWGQWL